MHALAPLPLPKSLSRSLSNPCTKKKERQNQTFEPTFQLELIGQFNCELASLLGEAQGRYDMELGREGGESLLACFGNG
jgi:hypothetical protein